MRLTLGLNRIGAPIDVETVGGALLPGRPCPRYHGALIVRDYAVAVPDDFVDSVKADTLRAFDAGLAAMPGVGDAVAGLALPHMRRFDSDPVRLAHTLGDGLLHLFEGGSTPRPWWRGASRRRTCSSTPRPAWARRRKLASSSRTACRGAGGPGRPVCGSSASPAAATGPHDRTGRDLMAAGAVRVFDDFARFAQSWRPPEAEPKEAIAASRHGALPATPRHAFERSIR